MQMNRPISSSSASDHDNQPRDPDDFVNEFNQRLRLDDHDNSRSQQRLRGSEIHADDEDEERVEDCEEDDENDGDFTFLYTGDKSTAVPADKAFESGQIRPAFPLFDRNLLTGDSYDQIGGEQLPTRPPVDKVFVESRHRLPPSTADEYDEIEGVAAGPYCTWSKKSATPPSELNKKSNSTGFSKLWRIRDKVGRSNSDGRDAFVFLNGSARTTGTSKSVTKPATAASGNRGKEKVVKKGTKVKKAKLSAHEVYLRKKEGQTGDERRRSYLPYRPELMGFFTNVNSGLSRNVHPY